MKVLVDQGPVWLGKAAPEEKQTGQGEEVGCGVKEPVAERVRFQTGDRGGGVGVDVAHHVMPLQDLVEHDAVEEAANPQSEQDAARGEHGRSRSFVVRPSHSPRVHGPLAPLGHGLCGESEALQIGSEAAMVYAAT